MRVESTLMATARLMREAYDAALEALDLNLTDASLLAYVVESGPLKQTSIADHLGIGRATAGNVIDRLQRRELVERQADVNDRRVWLVAPTATGKELAEEIAAIDVGLRHDLRLGIDRHERQMLATLLVRLQRNLLSTRARDTPPRPSHPTTDRKHT
jgi:DNA-binding MarR family transcriptional regulator